MIFQMHSWHCYSKELNSCVASSPVTMAVTPLVHSIDGDIDILRIGLKICNIRQNCTTIIIYHTCSQTLSSLHYHHHLFWKCPLLPWILPIQHVNQALSCHLLHILSMSSYPCPHISPLLPPHFYRLTPNHLCSYVPHAQTPSIYHVSPPLLGSKHPKDCKRPHFASSQCTTKR